MSALWYIIRKSLKNGLLAILRTPGKLVLYLVLIGLVVGSMTLAGLTRARAEEATPLFWFTGILFLYITLFVATYTATGLSNGNAIFEMNDVNLLFVSPINPRKTLLYGIIRMAKSAFVSSFFILFQANTLATLGIAPSGVWITLAGFLVSTLVLMVASLLIYSVTNGRPGRKNVVKVLGALLFAPLVVYLAVQYFQTQDLWLALEAAVNSPFLRFIPVAGWTAEGVSAFLTGNVAAGLLFFGLNGALAVGMIVYIALSNPDYYEDVLVATETAYEKKRAAAEGNVNAVSSSRKAVKVAKTGIPGSGAAALFGKHMRENFRENRFGFFSLATVLIVIGGVGLSLLTDDLFASLQALMWLQIFLIGTGRGLKETFAHYIYMIPESSFRKILWSNMEIMVRVLTESVLLFGIAGIALQAGFAYTVICIAVFTLFSLVLLGVNYLSMRLFGADLSAGILVMLYFLAVVVVMLPGVVAAIVAGVIIGGQIGLMVGLLLLAGWELAAGLGCFALSQGVLHRCDIAGMRPNR